MSSNDRIGVTSRSFSRHPALRQALLERYPNTRFNDKGDALKGRALADFLSGCDKAITALEVLDERLFAELPDLKVVGKYGVGLDMIDLQAMHNHGIKLGWEGGVNKRSVSELVISAAIALLHRVPCANREVLAGSWRQIRGRQLTGRTVGIIGCGHIGKDVIRLLEPFKCRVLSYDIDDFPKFYRKFGVQAVALNELLERSDIITLHLPLDDSTRNILSRQCLHKLKQGACLINYARGGLVDEQALTELLKSGHLGGAALDVFAVEPPVDVELPNLNNVLVTPHIGGSTEEAIWEMGMAAIKGLDNARDPIDFVTDPEKQYA